MSSNDTDKESAFSKDKRALGTLIIGLLGAASIPIGYYIFNNIELVLGLFLYSAWFLVVIFIGALVNNHLGVLTESEVKAILNLVAEQVQRIQNPPRATTPIQTAPELIPCSEGSSTEAPIDTQLDSIMPNENDFDDF